MTAFKYRMGAGFAGDVNRTHPASIEPAAIATATPPLGYGLAVVLNEDGFIRQMDEGDDALTGIYGITVRPFPQQQAFSNLEYGAVGYNSAIPPTKGAIDILRSGYIMGPVVGTPVKGDPVYVWIAESGAGHLQGGFETQADGTNTIPLSAAGSVATFNGPADENGIGEIVFNV